VSKIKAIGTAVHARLTIPATVMRTYQRANIRVFLFTAKNEADYARMVRLKPYGVVVDDVARFQRWRDSANSNA
jgi:glycerophosphoryl diester phosphodiesterase